MKQVLQHVRSGELEVAEIPAPVVGPGAVLIQTRASLISAGTERMLVEFSKASLIQKARQKPEQVELVLNLMKTDGILPTLEAVFRKLDEPLPLGYCNAGLVLETGVDVHDLQPGDRVAGNGPHAEIVSVPRNLCAKIPDGVSDEAGAFTVLASVALQGLRLAVPALGETFMVFGLGLVGLITVQLLRAQGCEVIGVDLNPGRLKLAESFGARTIDPGQGGDPVTVGHGVTGGHGVDGVMITAAAKNDDIVHQAARASRKRGRIILVGVVGLNLRRDDFYEKELSFQVSCSYGPGRYDEKYEQAGQDYPYGFVRWTEQRNFEAVLQTMASGGLVVDDLVSDRIAQADAVSAYDKIQNDPEALGVILRYADEVDRAPQVITADAVPASPAAPTIGLIGAGNFTNAVLAPALARTGARIAYVASAGGVSALQVARKYGAEKAVSDYHLILDDAEVQAVVIGLQHHLHAQVVREALEAGKHVFVEKPLCLTSEELEEITATYSSVRDGADARILMVGFNRRFSPHVDTIRAQLEGRAEPLCMTMTVNAGRVPASHWVHDPKRGGGRLLGEACHFIDLLSFIAGSKVRQVSAARVGDGPAVRDDKVAILLTFADGSIGTVNYFANGSKAYPKEKLEIYSDGRTLALENFRITRGFGCQGFKTFRTRRQDKGHTREIELFIAAIRNGESSPIPFDDLIQVTRASLAAVKATRDGTVIRISDERSIGE